MVTIYWSGVGLAAVAVTAWRPVGGRVVLSGGREAAKWLLCGGCGGRGVTSWGPRDGHFVITWWPVAAELWVCMSFVSVLGWCRVVAVLLRRGFTGTHNRLKTEKKYSGEKRREEKKQGARRTDNLAFVVGDDCGREGLEGASCQRLRHPVCPLVFAIAVDHVELLVAAVTVVAQEVVRDADVAGVFGCGVLVCQVDAWFVVFVYCDRSFNELARDGFDYVE